MVELGSPVNEIVSPGNIASWNRGFIITQKNIGNECKICSVSWLTSSCAAVQFLEALIKNEIDIGVLRKTDYCDVSIVISQPQNLKPLQSVQPLRCPLIYIVNIGTHEDTENVGVGGEIEATNNPIENMKALDSSRARTKRIPTLIIVMHYKSYSPVSNVILSLS